MASVTRSLFAVSSEYKNTERMWLTSCCVYASHLLSGDQDAWNICSGPVNRSWKTFTGVFFSRSTYHRFSRLSVYAIFLLSGDHVGKKKNDPGVPRSNFCASPWPFWFFTYKASSPDSSEKYAMLFPSGDHAGYRSSAPGVFVKFRMSPFSAGTVRISPRASNTALKPVGEMSALRIRFATFS